MITKLWKVLMALALAAMLSCAPGITPDTKVANGYPQMYNAEMLKNKANVEKEFNVKFLGCYDDTFGSYLFWVDELATGSPVCVATIISPNIPAIKLSCGEGWEVYLKTCKDVGNCV